MYLALQAAIPVAASALVAGLVAIHNKIRKQP
jgi:hypothetical protein